MQIKTPPNMPRIKKVIEHWPYRHFFDPMKRAMAGISGPLVVMYQQEYGFRDEERREGIEDLQRALAALCSPERPHNYIDNHSGFVVELKNGIRAFVLFSDLKCYMYQLPAT